MKTLEKTQYVKLTSKGKVSIYLTGTMRGLFLYMIEQMLTFTESSTRDCLSMRNAAERVRFALVSEIYTRHFASFSLLRNDLKLLLTPAQALAFWQLSQEYDFKPEHDPQMGDMLMQLHQKLL
jgi:hypothetical protein